MRIILHAPNVHHGGGRTLLLSLLHALSNTEAVAILDERLDLPPSLPGKIQVSRVAPTVYGRFLAEKRLASVAKPEDIVLCFGNLPPLLNTRGKIFVFLQNRYLLQHRITNGLKPKQRLRIALERLWLRWFVGNSTLIVQTDSMAREAQSVLKNNPVQVMPFVPAPTHSLPESTFEPKKYDFLYVATGEPHKNHRTLVEAWELLGAEGLFPSLCLTLHTVHDRELILWISNKASTAGLRISNVGIVTSIEIEKLYASSNALIYPSLFESFGLPLIEAFKHKLPLIASELDYVRDVSEPVETFDPNSAISIARAVKRHLGHQSTFNHLAPDEFLHSLVSDTTTQTN